MSETQIKRDILDYCAKAGIFAKRRNVAGVQRMHGHFVKLGDKGMVDLWGILRFSGRHWEYELKKPGKEPTEKQMEWLEECKSLGAYVGWGDSLEDFIDFMKHAR